ncbi:TPA: phage tail protein [Escherichia coli]|uniref:phage tail protein n=1 Tax=Escherichia coli TaxID=562 RepID=UPI000BB60392|nr:phage tail protein [Escherichia coli]EFK7447201.1 phage tail protein [Escherichia coli]EHJ8048694.1 phage tail protein [Escherichia coli]ELZ8462268.1 phage tail protein [Escherichia coli]PBQ91262.1 phage tail protein [Escherichia coli]HAI1384946.1 phage tail protein [Escherichia coli]
MHRIDTLTAVKDKFGPGKNGFTDGNIRTGRLATWLNSAMWDAIQEEICGVIEKAGIELNKEEHDQLYKAILLLVGGAINEEALLIKNNLSDVEDKDEAVENLGLKPTVDKAKNAVQRDGDTMTGELKIRGVNALRIFNEAFGLIFRRSEECLHLIPTQENQGENGDIGPLRPFTMNLRTGEITMSKVSVGGDSQVRGALGIGVQNALGGNSIAFGDNDTGLKQNGDGLLDVYANGQHVFRFQNGALQSNRAVNVSGRVTPSDYGNFDARYQTKSGGVQNFQYTSEVFYNPGGNERSWTFRAPSGCVLSGINVQDTGSNSADNIGGVYYKQAQIYINGAWRSVSG